MCEVTLKLVTLSCISGHSTFKTILLNYGIKQGNHRLHFACALHSRHPFPPIGDAAYRQHAAGGLSHEHRQHAQKICWRSHVWFWRYPHGQTDTQTNILVTTLHNCSRGRSNKHIAFVLGWLAMNWLGTFNNILLYCSFWVIIYHVNWHQRSITYLLVRWLKSCGKFMH